MPESRKLMRISAETLVYTMRKNAYRDIELTGLYDERLRVQIWKLFVDVKRCERVMNEVRFDIWRI